MTICSHARAKVDPDGAVEYYCDKLTWRMGLDGLEHCKQCAYYTTEKKQAGRH
ncbi:MAG: hypothetical protein WAP20_02825 [Limnochordia bacterium]|jgi:hypothetical protein|nr:hypothetical protein [Bacillota bacterium]HOB08857.1 hypothetical protein [Limnochordia bacterium]NLH31745.1 hypothetical protein [Bacillota bacterium]HPT93073.1 hypothetical protein [Limnochordia bacterium]HPZ31053.1 hypothetical protein [Limnochordia bacterium]